MLSSHFFVLSVHPNRENFKHHTGLLRMRDWRTKLTPFMTPEQPFLKVSPLLYHCDINGYKRHNSIQLRDELFFWRNGCAISYYIVLQPSPNSDAAIALIIKYDHFFQKLEVLIIQLHIVETKLVTESLHIFAAYATRKKWNQAPMRSMVLWPR